MNTRPALEPVKQPFALAAAFNADNSCFSVAHESGFKVFKSSSCEIKISRDLSGGIGCADMVDTSNYIILAGGGKSPYFPANKINIWEDKDQKVAGSLELKTSVLRVRASKQYLVVALPCQVTLYKMNNPPRHVQAYDTLENYYGLLSFENNVVATLAANPGQVRIIRAPEGDHNPRVTLIPAHNTRLRAIALNKKADMVATASEKGTIIRVFAVESGTKIAEFRRGVDEAAIFSLAFSPHDKMLAVTSDKSTVHLFELPNGIQKAASADPKTHKYGFLSKVPLLPRQFSDVYSCASAPFQMGDALGGSNPKSKAATEESMAKWAPGPVPTKGLLGWLDDNTLLVVGAGQDARWEKFVVDTDQTGKVFIQSLAWKHYFD